MAQTRMASDSLRCRHHHHHHRVRDWWGLGMRSIDVSRAPGVYVFFSALFFALLTNKDGLRVF